MTPAEETNERNACDEWFHEKGGATIQETWVERGRRAEADAKRYQWLANRVLACDYGDNDMPGQIGWRIISNLLPSVSMGRQPAFMYGTSIDSAIDAEIAKESGAFEPCAFCAQPNTCTEAGGCDRGAK